MNETIRVAVVDDHPMFRDGVISSLRADANIQVVGQGASAADALHLAQEHLPDILLLDLTMPGGGLDAARAIAASCPVTKIVILTVSENEDDLLNAIKAGARAYILKGVAGNELARLVRAVYQGEAYIAPKLANRMLIEMTRAPRAENPLDQLTEREHQILELVASGATNREAGAHLHLAEKTVRHYMTNILQKLHVRSRVEAALLAQKAGLGDAR
ncbi:MAG: response regulator transcription factor [Chloroflexi bacterium]|nr:response regulator transcription factor [Chloroflexota bacterium]